MAEDPEAHAQLARLLGDERVRIAGTDEIHAAVEQGFNGLVEGLLAEATASDDVIDRASGLDFVSQRLRFLGDLLTVGQHARLLQALEEKIEAWW